jgi:MOSC domain-containing protein YiiM
MKLISLNTGLPREVIWHGRSVTTGIFKQPIDQRVALRTLNLDGDRQADLSVHGGVYKAVYCYPLEHYAFWAGALPGRDLPMASFGENFTTTGLSEDTVHVGDRFAVGSAEIVVTQPRLPCYKLGIRFQSDAMVKTFLAAGRSGFYVAVVREGDVGAGDAFSLLSRDSEAVSVADITRLYAARVYSAADVDLAGRTLTLASLPESWKEYFRERLQQVVG